jgi:hypothetical protein
LGVAKVQQLQLVSGLRQQLTQFLAGFEVSELARDNQPQTALGPQPEADGAFDEQEVFVELPVTGGVTLAVKLIFRRF